MKHGLLLLVFAICGLGLHAQKVEFGDVHWHDDDRIMYKMHIKDTIPFEGKTEQQVHDLVESWFLKTYLENDLVHTYRIDPGNGRLGWYTDHKSAFYQNKPWRIWTRNVKCEDCYRLRWSRKKDVDTDGYFMLDVRIMDGRAVVVMSDFYTEDLNNFVYNITENKIPANDRERSYFQSLEDVFAEVRASLLTFTEGMN